MTHVAFFPGVRVSSHPPPSGPRWRITGRVSVDDWTGIRYNSATKPDLEHHAFPLAIAYALAVVNALVIGSSFSFVKVAVDLAEPVDTLAFRLPIALAIVFLFARIKGIRTRFGWKNTLRLLPMRLCYPLGFFLFQAYGTLYATSGEAGILAATGPIFTTMFIRKRYNLIQCLLILLSVAGVLYITYRKGESLDPGHIAGIALILLSALSGAGYAVLNRVFPLYY